MSEEKSSAPKIFKNLNLVECISYLQKNPNSVTEFVETLQAPQVKKLLKKNDLFKLINEVKSQALTIGLLVNFHAEFSDDDLYMYALLDNEVALAFAKTPSLQNRMPKKWPTLIKLDTRVAELALSSPKWSVIDKFSAEDLRILACKEEKLAKIVFDRFGTTKLSLFSKEKLKLSHWQEIAVRSGELGNNILASDIGKRFDAHQLLEIARDNPLTRMTILEMSKTTESKGKDSLYSKILTLISDSLTYKEEPESASSTSSSSITTTSKTL